VRRAPALTALAIALAAIVAACGEKEEPPPPPVESADPLPKLPREWKRHVNGRAGFVIGVPRQWSARDRRSSSLLRSPDRLVAVSVSADRGEGALVLPVERFAARVADALSGFKRLRADRPRPFRARYEAAAVRATGRTKEGDVPQRLLVVVERREGIATYTVLVAENANAGTKRHRAEIRRMLRSLRGRPPR
jgi:hypothetical protein